MLPSFSAARSGRTLELPHGTREVFDLRLFKVVPSAHSYLIRYDLAQFDIAVYELENILRPSEFHRLVPSRQANFFFGRFAAKLAMADAGIRDIQIATGMYREPVWPAGTVGSITHCSDLAAACIAQAADCRGLGIDIEQIPERDALEAIRGVALRDDEEKILAAAVSETLSWDLLLTLVFSAKEALFKALFPMIGRYFGFESARILRIDSTNDSKAMVILELTEKLSDTLPVGASFKVSWQMLRDDVVLTCCLC